MRSTYSPRAHGFDTGLAAADASEPGRPVYTARPVSRGTRAMLHVLAGFIALVLSQIIAIQLYVMPMSVELFASLQFPMGFAFAAAVLEALAMMLVLFPRTRFYGAALTVALMVASLALFATMGFPFWPVVVSLVLLAASGVLLVFYRGTRANLFISERRHAHEERLRQLREQHLARREPLGH